MENETTTWIFVGVGLVLATIFVLISVMRFLNKPTSEQIKNIKEWLLWAVSEAEKALGSGTGALKLRYVYDLAVKNFPWVSIIPFETFSEWVDEALEGMRHELEVNEKIKNYIEGEQR